MREIEKIANENFNGHIEDALENLIKNKDSRFGKIVKELNKKEATFAFQKLHEYHVDKIIDDEFGGKEQFANDVLLEMKLDELGMTKEDVISSSKNPFSVNIRNATIKLCLAVFIPLIIYMLIKGFTDAEWLFYVQGCLITYFSCETANWLMKYLKFKNIKNKVQTQTIKNDFTIIKTLKNSTSKPDTPNSFSFEAESELVELVCDGNNNFYIITTTEITTAENNGRPSTTRNTKKFKTNITFENISEITEKNYEEYITSESDTLL